MTWHTTLTTRDALLGYLGNVQIAEGALDDIANGVDSRIQDYCGAHPVISHADDTPAEIALKQRTLQRRILAFYQLVRIELRMRAEGLPAFKGFKPQGNPLEAERMSVLRDVGINDWA